MIISKTPLRISFTGGGSDMQSYYRKFGGSVISTTIDKYIYVTVNKKFDHGIRIGYSKNEEVNFVSEIEHPIVKASMEFLDLKGGVEITTIADIPSKGTGLGSSSSFTVGLLNALNAYMGRFISSGQLGKDSCHIEIECCGEPIGKQDQFAAAYGGFNLIQFNQNDTVEVSPIICNPETIEKIQKNILVFYTGKTRNASNILEHQNIALSEDIKKQEVMHKMVGLTKRLASDLRRNDIDSFGEILNEGWHLKKSLTDNISSEYIDILYNQAKEAGALGGKILGAGNGGFLMMYAPQTTHQAVIRALSTLKLMPISFEKVGSRIIFFNK